MKIKGRNLNTPNEEIIVIPRGNDEPLIFTARAVLDMSDFERLCPRPEPPTITYRDGRVKQDDKDAKYLKAIDSWARKHTAYIILKSLEATEGIEWEKCDLGDPETWESYEEEFKLSGLAPMEVRMIVTGVLTANSMNEEKMVQAREHFLAQRLQLNGSSSRRDDHTIM